MKKQITIVSDGTAQGTNILDSDGKKMEMGKISAIEWQIDSITRMGMAKVTFTDVAVHLIGKIDG